jgi:hypothetical protein
MEVSIIADFLAKRVRQIASTALRAQFRIRV